MGTPGIRKCDAPLRGQLILTFTSHGTKTRPWSQICRLVRTKIISARLGLAADDGSPTICRAIHSGEHLGRCGVNFSLRFVVFAACQYFALSQACAQADRILYVADSVSRGVLNMRRAPASHISWLRQFRQVRLSASWARASKIRNLGARRRGASFHGRRKRAGFRRLDWSLESQVPARNKSVDGV